MTGREGMPKAPGWELPDAMQVADRWHLWHNLGEAVERSVARHRQVPRTRRPNQPPPSGAGDTLEDSPSPAISAGSRRGDRVAARTRQRHQAIHQRLAEGHSVRAVAAELGLARNTVRRFAAPQTRRNCWSMTAPAGGGMLDEHEPYLQERWNQGCTDAAACGGSSCARGYPGGYSLVRDYLTQFRQHRPRCPRHPQSRRNRAP